MKRLISAVTVAVAVVAAALAVAAPASAAEIKYELRPLNSGKCLDIVNGSRANGARIQQWTCSGAPQQKWYLRGVGGEYYNIVSAHDAACLDLRDNLNANGAVVQQWTCSGAYNQVWQVTWDASMGAYRIKPDVGDKCLDVTGVSTANGAYMQIWDCAYPGVRNQRFRLVA